jgi:hypothetical protein
MGEATRIPVADGVVAWSNEVTIRTPAGLIPCWLLHSDGLRAFDHPELALPVRAHPSLERGAVAGTLVQLLSAIVRVAATGQRVTAGGTTRLGGPILGFDGVFYAPAAPIGDVHLPSTTLIGILASTDELAGVERYGARRMCSLLARQTRYYPYPPWTDVHRDRMAVASAPTVLAEMPIAALPGATITREGSALHFRLSRSRSAPVLRAILPQLPVETPPTFALHDVAAEADACLVWLPDQQAPEAVAPPGSRAQRLGGCFLATANQQPSNGSQIVEDGYAYFLRDADFARLRAAWESESDIAIQGDQPGDDLFVSWIDDGDGGGAAASAPAPAPAPTTRPSRVRLVGVQLVTEPSGAGDAKSAAEYIRALAATADHALPSYGAPYEVRLDVSIAPPRPPQILIATRPITPPGDALQQCVDELGAVPAPHVSGVLAFQAHLAVEAD